MFDLHRRQQNARTATLLIACLLAMLLIIPVGGCSPNSESSTSSSSSSPAAIPANSYRLILNGQESTISDSQLYEKDGRLMMVARPALETLGVWTYWDEDYKQLYLMNQEHNASFDPYSNYYTYDTIENVTDVSNDLVNGELAVPVDRCFGALGAEIDWDKTNRTLSITLPPEPDTSDLQKVAKSGVQIETRISESPAIKEVLAAQCQAASLPAMGGAIVWDDGRIDMAVSGVRKLGETTPAATSDLWHMGSCTKAMTATMIAYLVEQGDLRWDLTMAEAFPQYQAGMDSQHAAIDIDMLLTHTAGFPRDPDFAQFERDYTLGLDAAGCRLLLAKQAAEVSLEYPPGQGYVYSNMDYITAGSMAEQARGAKWEDLMSELVFTPLGIAAVSYAGTGNLGQIDQPWPHDMDRQPITNNGPFGDLYAMFMGPCGYAHLSLESWGKFIIDQMRGLQGRPALLQPLSYQHLVEPAAANPQYAHGWELIPPGPDGSPAYGHSGSNGFNTCVVKMYPGRGYAVLVTTNLGDFLTITPENYPPVHDSCQQTAEQLVSLAESSRQ